MTSNLIAGESIDDIGLVLLQLNLSSRPDRDGMVRFDGRLEPDLALPFRRALLRVEADLLQTEADELTAASRLDDRSIDNRRADAFVELIRRFGDALGLPEAEPG